MELEEEESRLEGGLNLMELSSDSDSVNDSMEESFDLDIISEALELDMTKLDSPENNPVEREGIEQDLDDADGRSLRRKNDSQSRSDTDWVERLADKRIEEFADVNQGEKTFFKLWNRHVRFLGDVGIRRMPAVVMR